MSGVKEKLKRKARKTTKYIKDYSKDFATDESGMELLQLAIVVVVTVGLIGVVIALQNMISGNIDSATEQAGSAFSDALNN